MKTVRLVTSDDVEFPEVCEFANSVYLETIGASTRNPPDTLFAAFDHETPFGCIGFHDQISSNVFLKDERFVSYRKSLPAYMKFGEQNIFAVKNFPSGIPILIAVESAFANTIGINKMAFTGIAVTCKAIKNMGFDLKILGETTADVFSEEEKVRYGYWLKKYRPISCVLDTRNALAICQNVMARFSHKASLSYELESCLLLRKAVG